MKLSFPADTWRRIQISIFQIVIANIIWKMIAKLNANYQKNGQNWDQWKFTITKLCVSCVEISTYVMREESKVFLGKLKVSHMASPLGIFIETQMMSVVSTFIWTVPDIDYILRFLMLDASIHRVLWLIAIVRLIKKFILNIGIFFFSFWPHTYEPCVANQNNSQ